MVEGVHLRDLKSLLYLELHMRGSSEEIAWNVQYAGKMHVEVLRAGGSSTEAVMLVLGDGEGTTVGLEAVNVPGA